MVFQSYALYPHMNVEQNLRLRPGEPEACQSRRSKQRVAKAADILQIEHLLKPRPKPAVRRPEPARRDRPRHRQGAEGLSVRRAAVQSRCRTACEDARRRLVSAAPPARKSTMIYVTHDQVEAMTMADQIVVLRRGHHRTDRPADGALCPPALTSSSPASSARRR